MREQVRPSKDECLASGDKERARAKAASEPQFDARAEITERLGELCTLMERHRPVCHLGTEWFIRDADSRDMPLTERQLRRNDCDRLYVARRTAAPDTYDADSCMETIALATRVRESEVGGTGGRKVSVEPVATRQNAGRSQSQTGDSSSEDQKTVERITAIWDVECVSSPDKVAVPTTEWCGAGAKYDRLTAILPRTGTGYHGFSFAAYMCTGINPGYHEYPHGPIGMQTKVRRKDSLKLGEKAGVCIPTHVPVRCGLWLGRGWNPGGTCMRSMYGRVHYGRKVTMRWGLRCRVPHELCDMLLKGQRWSVRGGVSLQVVSGGPNNATSSAGKEGLSDGAIEAIPCNACRGKCGPGGLHIRARGPCSVSGGGCVNTNIPTSRPTRVCGMTYASCRWQDATHRC